MRHAERIGSPTGRAPLRSEVHPRLRVRWTAVGVMLLVAVSSASTGVLIGVTVTLNAQTSSNMLLPCLTEDSTGCYWDAETMGNGRGHDVVTP
jgi:hypothetical protein